MSAYFQSPYVVAYNQRILASPSAKFVLAVVVIVSLLVTTDTVPNLRPNNKWIIHLNTTPARLVMLSLCFYYLKTQPTLAFAMAGMLLICIHWYNQLRTAETFVALAYAGEGLINNACTGVTTKDLLDMFDGNKYDLQRVARLCGVAVGVDCTAPENSAYIASMMVQSGIAVTNSCSGQSIEPTLQTANSRITMPIVAIPEIAQVIPTSTNVVAGNTNLATGMNGVMIGAPIVGAETVHLSSLH